MSDYTIDGQGPTICTECLKPCPLHFVLYCPTCHKHEGECQFGACEADATHLVEHPREIRRFCTEHATDPTCQYARTGCTVTPDPEESRRLEALRRDADEEIANWGVDR